MLKMASFHGKNCSPKKLRVLWAGIALGESSLGLKSMN